MTLSCVQTWPSPPNERTLLFSGFLVDVCAEWFYVTAGHILRDIRKSLRAGGKFDIWRLGDQTAGNKFKDTAIPFAFDIDRWLVIEDEEIGLDYAVVMLEPIYRQLLSAGGVTPIDKTAWGDYAAEHDQWVLVGIPSETVMYDGETLITARVIVAPIKPADSPEMAGQKAKNQFFGHLMNDPAKIVQDIDGMSGGPIFALKKIQGTWKYMVIGVQSGWYPTSRIIAACPFTSLGLELEQLVETARSLQEKYETNTT